MKISVVYGSAAPNENEEMLTRHVINGMPEVTEIYLRDYNVKSRDQLHACLEKDEYNQVVDQIIESDVLVLSTPMYCYGVSGLMKTFVDRWPMVDEEDSSRNFMAAMHGKQVYLIIAGEDYPHKKALPIIQQFKYICRAAAMDFNGYLIAEAGESKDVEKNEAAIKQAQALGRLLAGKEKSNELTS